MNRAVVALTLAALSLTSASAAELQQCQEEGGCQEDVPELDGISLLQKKGSYLLKEGTKLVAKADQTEKHSFAAGLFSVSKKTPVGSHESSFSCGTPGDGTAQPAKGPGGCLNAQPSLGGFAGAEPQTVISFLVQPCGIVAPHNHANAAEVNTVIKGTGVIAQLTTQTGQLEVSQVSEGDTFVFAKGAYHWWMNLGTEQLVTVGAFLNTDAPDMALLGNDGGAGVVGSLMHDATLLDTLIGTSSSPTNTVASKDGSPLFPQFTKEACERVRSQQFSTASRKASPSFQVNPPATKLYKADELQTGVFGVTGLNTPISGPGGGLRPLAGDVGPADMPAGGGGTGGSSPPFDGGLAPTADGGGPPPPALWPGFTNVAGGKSLVKFVVSYCGVVGVHTHVNAAEWNTVISGSGRVSYYQVNSGETPQVVTKTVKVGDTFVFPQGSPHWWVNESPNEQLATVGGFTAPFPDTALLANFFSQSNDLFPGLMSAVIGDGFVPSPEAMQGGLFPALSTRHPANCGGDVPCQKCL